MPFLVVKNFYPEKTVLTYKELPGVDLSRLDLHRILGPIK
jgi:hypothetical protein